MTRKCIQKQLQGWPWVHTVAGVSEVLPLPLPAVSMSMGETLGLPPLGDTISRCFPRAGFRSSSCLPETQHTEISGREAPCYCPC